MMESHLAALIKAIRNAKSDGRDDGLGNPVIGVDLYQASALKACDEIERLQAIDDALPKTEDGVPMLSGGMYWLNGRIGYDNGAVALVNAKPVFLRLRGGYAERFVGRWYSTKAAAEAASENSA